MSERETDIARQNVEETHKTNRIKNERNVRKTIEMTRRALLELVGFEIA